MTASSVAFVIAFNLGAFETIFFVRVFTLWVAATIVLIASFLTSIEPKGWPGRAALMLPSVWLVVQVGSSNDVVSISDNIIEWLALVTALWALPYLGYSIIGAIDPDFLSLPRRNRAAIAIAVVTFSIVGLVVGANNDLFLTCEDFKVSGNDQPRDCRPAGGEQNS